MVVMSARSVPRPLRRKVLGAAAAAAALALAVTGAPAAADTPTPAPTCGQNDLSVVSTNASSHPTASSVGAKAVDSITVENVGPTDLQGVFLDFWFGPVQGPASTPPSFWWQLDGTGWQTGSLSWNNSQNVGPWSAWVAAANGIGSFPAGSTHTLEFAVAFVSISQAGSYTSVLGMGATSCGYELVHQSMNLAFSPPAPTQPTTAAAVKAPAATTAAATAGTSQTTPTTGGSAPGPASPSGGVSAASGSPTDTESGSTASADSTAMAAAAASDSHHASGGSSGTVALVSVLVAVLLLIAAGVTTGVVMKRRRGQPPESTE